MLLLLRNSRLKRTEALLLPTITVPERRTDLVGSKPPSSAEKALPRSEASCVRKSQPSLSSMYARPSTERADECTVLTVDTVVVMGNACGRALRGTVRRMSSSSWMWRTEVAEACRFIS